MLPADIFHRYHELKGTDHIFVCGSDVHGTPLELEALEQEIDVEELKEKNHEKVKDVLERFKLDFDIYSETHSDYNRKQTHDMFTELYLNGYVKEKEQTLAYCNDDERFLPDRYIEGACPHCGGLARGDQCDDCGKLVEPEELDEIECQICGGNNVEFRDTTHLFLDLPQFEGELREWLENADPQPVPDSSKKEVMNTIDSLEDRCITRDINWGFDVPVERVNQRIEDEGVEVPKLDAERYDDKVLYVWFDAPIGYIGFTRELFAEKGDEEEWKDYWTGDADVYYSIGKDNTVFHTVIWPSMLTGSSTEEIDYALPHYEFIQQYLLAEDTKFSKSRGKGLRTEEALDMHPSDYWRFYLAKNMPEDHDTKFSWDDFESTINNVLNDTVGNFVNRTLSLSEKWFDNKVPVAELEYDDREVISEAEDIVEEYQDAFEEHELREGLEKALELARLGDRYLSEEEPWNNEERREPVIQVCIQIIRGLAVTLYPFTPDTTGKIEDMLQTSIHTEEDDSEFIDPLIGGVAGGSKLGEREILFEKVDVTQDEEEVEEETLLNTETISFEEFGDMDLRVGQVEKVEEHPNADKLYKVQVDVGETTLQTCAGLKNHYSKEELEGRKVVVLANLEPAELRGEVSECMMLAAEDDKGNVSLLGTDKEMKVGSEVK
ncbi:MAG: methionyl-tRNA synthetase [Candidatus Nanohaloarchaea archaeon]|jgi:methionyl-tRNA synthetase